VASNDAILFAAHVIEQKQTKGGGKSTQRWQLTNVEARAKATVEVKQGNTSERKPQRLRPAVVRTKWMMCCQSLDWKLVY